MTIVTDKKATSQNAEKFEYFSDIVDADIEVYYELYDYGYVNADETIGSYPQWIIENVFMYVDGDPVNIDRQGLKTEIDNQLNDWIEAGWEQ